MAASGGNEGRLSATGGVHHGWKTLRSTTGPPAARCGSAAEDAAFARALATLSKRERQLLRLRAQGLTIVEICERCFIGEETVKTHLHRAYRKLELGGLQDHGRCSRASYLLGRYDANVEGA